MQWNVFGQHEASRQHRQPRAGAAAGRHRPAVQQPAERRRPNQPRPASRRSRRGVLSGTAPFGFMVGKLIAGGVQADVLINALEEKGLARRAGRAEPGGAVGRHRELPRRRRISRSRCPARSATVTVEYKSYGVGLAFTPTVLGDGLINLKIEPEVSQLDSSHHGHGRRHLGAAADRAPRLHHGRAARRPELRDRRPAAERSARPRMQQLPWLGDVPVLGALFRSASYQKNETDLVIIVTPRLVRPARPGDVDQDAARQHAAGERRRFLPARARPKSRAPMERRLAGAPTASRSIGHMLDLPQGRRPCSCVTN